MKGLDQARDALSRGIETQHQPLSATAQEQFSKPKDIPTLIKE
jgi:hypothetical protein